MKLIFFISSLQAGGAERVAALLLNHWVNHIEQVILITFDTPKGDFFLLDKRIQRYCLGNYKTSPSFFKKIYQHGMRVLKALKIVYQEKPTVILSFLIDVNLLVCLLKFFINIPVIISERTYVPYYVKDGLLKKLLPFLYKKADFYIAQTQQGAGWAKTFLDEGKVEVLANPVMASLSPEEEKRRPILLAVGRLVPEKGFDILIQACHECLKKHLEWELWIVGEGPERPLLEKLIDHYHMEGQIFLKGRQQNTASFYAIASIFILSSKVEGFPNALLEAMAQGMAVISVDCLTGPRDIIINNHNGLLVEEGNILSLTHAINCLIENTDLRSTLGKNALQVRADYSLDKIAGKWIDLFKKIS